MNKDSSWAGQHDSPLDRAIDRAVREMMHVDPPSGLRRRVLLRLDSRPRRGFFVPRYAWAAAALLILIIGITFTRDRGSEPANGGPVTSQAVHTPQPNVSPPPLETATPSAAATERRGGAARVTRETIRMPRVGNLFGSPSPAVSATDTHVDAVRPGIPTAAPGAVAPLVIDPLVPTRIETPIIVIAPLVIAAPKGGQDR